MLYNNQSSSGVTKNELPLHSSCIGACWPPTPRVGTCMYRYVVTPLSPLDSVDSVRSSGLGVRGVGVGDGVIGIAGASLRVVPTLRLVGRTSAWCRSASFGAG